MKILIVGFVWPEPKSSAAGQRMMQLIDFFISENYEVVFATTAIPTPHRVNLSEMGVKAETIELNNPSFDLFLEKLQPNIVLFDRFMMEEQFGWRVSQICPKALKILDTEDLHFLRKVRQEAFLKNKKTDDLLFESEVAKREIASIFRCDLSLIISSEEIKILKEKFQVPDYLLFHLPFMIEELTETQTADLPSFEKREHFISIGNFRHDPNWDAVLYLKQHIWPLIHKKLPETEMHIYGAYPPKKATTLNNLKENFLIKGWADSSENVIKNSRVLLAPLRFGAGLKGKLAEAMQFGTPSVTTTIGAEAMSENDKWNGFIEDSPEKFAKKAVELYLNENLWEKAQKNGFEILDFSFSKKKLQQSFKERIDETLLDKDQNRSRNFTGAMLQHHMLNSTKYLSKYIEIKNKMEK